MEELKELVSLINTLPALALWVVIGFWTYKVIIVGSIYSLIKFIVDKLYRAYVRPEDLVNRLFNKSIDVATENLLKEQVLRVINLSPGTSNYIHASDVKNLQEAIDDFVAKKKKGN